MQLNLFEGGLSTRLDASLIQPNEAVIYSNIDNNSAVLKPEKGLTVTTDVASANFYRFNNAWVSSTNDRDYLEYKDTLYYTEPATQPKKFDGTTTTNLGIAKPPTIPAVVGGSPVYDFEGVQVQGIVVEDLVITDEDFGTPVLTKEGSGSEFPVNTYNYRLTLLSGDVEVVYKDYSLVTTTQGDNLKVSLTTFNNQTIKI